MDNGGRLPLKKEEIRGWNSAYPYHDILDNMILAHQEVYGLIPDECDEWFWDWLATAIVEDHPELLKRILEHPHLREEAREAGANIAFGTEQQTVHIHRYEGKAMLDFLEIGNRLPNGTVRVHFDSTDTEDAKKRILNAKMLRDFGKQQLGD
jgi:hypothetical protein